MFCIYIKTNREGRRKPREQNCQKLLIIRGRNVLPKSRITFSGKFRSKHVGFPGYICM